MDNQDIVSLNKKVKDGTATTEERVIFLRVINERVAKLRDLIKELNLAVKNN